MNQTKRNLLMALPAMLAAASFAKGQEATQNKDAVQKKATLPSHIYSFDDLPVHDAGPLVVRNMFDGMIFEGCHISLHESDLAPHSRPHPPHKHRHEEMVLVVEGMLEFTVNGKATRAGEGSVLFAGSNDEHGIFNPEATHAKYFVFALGAESA